MKLFTIEDFDFFIDGQDKVLAMDAANEKLNEKIKEVYLLNGSGTYMHFEDPSKIILDNFTKCWIIEGEE